MRNIVILVIPLLILIVGLWWRKVRGNGPRGRGTVIAQYEPPEDLTPAEVSVIMHGRVTNAGIIGEIVELARLGYIQIVRTREIVPLLPDKITYTFERLKSSFELEPGFRHDLMKAISTGVLPLDERLKKRPKGFWHDIRSSLSELAVGFGWLKPDLTDYNSEVSRITLGQLKTALTDRLRSSKNLLQYSLSERGYLLANSELWTLGRGVVGLAGTLVVYLIVGSLYGDRRYPYAGFYLSLFVSVIIVLLLTWKTSIYQPKGVVVREYVLGLREYLQVAEKGRLEFYPDDDSKDRVFETLLPYALALEVETAWAEKFKEISSLTPVWYSDSISHESNSAELVSQLQEISRQLT